MKLKVVVVDLEISSRVKKWALRLGIPVAVLLGGGAIAYAATLVTWTTGQTLQAADLNSNFSLLQSEITALQTSPSGFQARLSANFTPPASGTGIVTFDTVDFDLNNEYTAATGVFSPKSAGTYVVYCNVFYSASSATAVGDLTIEVNGAGVGDNHNYIPTLGGAVVGTGITASSAVSLKAGDQVVCEAGGGAVGQVLSATAEPHGNIFYAVRAN